MNCKRTVPVVRLAPVPDGSNIRVRSWIKEFKLGRLQDSIDAADYRVISKWIRERNPTTPRPDTIRTIIGLSQKFPLSVGELRYEDFFGAVVVLEVIERPIRRSMTDPRHIITRRPF
jgi:hypothetical protein